MAGLQSGKSRIDDRLSRLGTIGLHQHDIQTAT